MSNRRESNIQKVKKALAGQIINRPSKTYYSAPTKVDSPPESRKVGDTWTDNDGNEYEQKDGFVVKNGWRGDLMKDRRDFLTSPRNCKEGCKCDFKKNIDVKMLKIHGMCFDCVLDMEHNLKKKGLFEKYQEKKILENKKSFLNETRDELESYVTTDISKMFIDGNGMVEKWSGGEHTITLCKKAIEEIDKDIKDISSKIQVLDDTLQK